MRKADKILDTLLSILTYRSQERIKEVLCTTPEVHVVGQLGAEDWDVGEWAGKSNGQRTVQSARIESYVLDTWNESKVKHMGLAVDIFMLTDLFRFTFE